MRYILFLLVLLFVASGSSVVADEAKVPARDHDPAFRWLVGGYVALQGADVYLTLRGAERGFEEANPVFPTGTRVVLAKAIIAPLTTWSLVRLHREHPKLAKGIAIALDALYLGVAAHNIRVLREE